MVAPAEAVDHHFFPLPPYFGEIMQRASRVLALSLVALVGVGGCKKKQPETTVTPVTNTPAPTPSTPAPPPAEACDAACREREANARNSAIAAATSALTATIYFTYDASDITDESRVKLDAKVPVMTQSGAIRIRIAGHTDSRGSDEYNLALGQRRAAAAKRYLTDRGIDGSRIEIVSFGEERPTCTEEDESCFSRNRRDEFEITAGQIAAGQTTSR
jgi:peptidoglycan-associated lipoprotein